MPENPLPPPKNDILHNAILGIVCTLVIVIFVWVAESALFPIRHAENSYYNLLVQGFQAGQLNIITPAPAGLAKVANPYDPASFMPYAAQIGDMSYYKGKVYLYWGVTPVLVLLWPFAALTGHYLSDADAIVIFLSAGFLITAILINAIRRDCFPNVPFWIMAIAILLFGVAIGAQEMAWQLSGIYQVALSSGFVFTMASLAAIWRAMKHPKRQAAWLMLASLAYGLAIGSRPSLLFGAIVLLIPVVHAWRTTPRPDAHRRTIPLFVAAVIPITLIVLGLMTYNQLRFDSPFEFGWRYQLNSDRAGPPHQFGLQYFPFNIRYYFFEPIHWAGHFPYVQTIPDIVLPSGNGPVGKSYGGILLILPLVWLALAAPLAWRDSIAEPVFRLRWFAAGTFLIFAACAFTICLFAYSFIRYELDFLPALLLLALIGILGIEQRSLDSPTQRRIGRAIWCLLAVITIIVNIFASVESLADMNFTGAADLLSQGRANEAVQYFQKTANLEPGSPMYHAGLGVSYQQMGRHKDEMIEYQKTLELDPTFPETHFKNNLEIMHAFAEARYDTGLALFKTGRMAEAAPYLEKALEVKPVLADGENITENANMAWSFASNPEASKRNGALAVKLAEGACRQTHYQIAIIVGTLAAAYAEAGRYDEAVSTAQKAIALARQNGQTDLLKKNQELLALYLKHQPYHESQEPPK